MLLLNLYSLFVLLNLLIYLVGFYLIPHLLTLPNKLMLLRTGHPVYQIIVICIVHKIWKIISYQNVSQIVIFHYTFWIRRVILLMFRFSSILWAILEKWIGMSSCFMLRTSSKYLLDDLAKTQSGMTILGFEYQFSQLQVLKLNVVTSFGLRFFTLCFCWQSLVLPIYSLKIFICIISHPIIKHDTYSPSAHQLLLQQANPILLQKPGN